MHSQDSSTLRPKGTMLERAIRELEKIVAECELFSGGMFEIFIIEEIWKSYAVLFLYTPALVLSHDIYVSLTARPVKLEVQDGDTSSIAVKRRLPSEVKQKLAKVARLAVNKHIFCLLLENVLFWYTANF